MRLLPALLALALLVPAPALATSAEATVLLTAATDMQAVGAGMNSGTLAEAAVKVAAIRDTIGEVTDYTPDCRPAATYVTAMADTFHTALVLAVATSPQEAWGEILISAALFTYWGNPTGGPQGALQACSVGL